MKKSNNDLVKCDLHVHIDNNISKENLIKLLQNAERNGVKYLSILEHYNLDLYRENGVLQKLIESGEIEKYYSGKLITGVEMTCRIDDGVVSKKTGFDFSGHYVHVTVLNFDVKKAEKIGTIGENGEQISWLKPGFLPEALKVNEQRIRNMLRQRGIPEPPEGYFKCDAKHDSIEKQLYNYYYVDKPEIGAAFDEVYGKSLTPSIFVKRFFGDPNGVLRYDNYYYPLASDCIAKLSTLGTVALSHPAYMHEEFEYMDYAETILENYGKIFDTIEVPYAQNTPEETDKLLKFATSYNLPLIAGGTDSCLTKSGQMYLVYNGSKIYYTPNLGVAKKTQMLGGKNNGEILLSENDMKKAKFTDLREQERFNSKSPANQAGE